MKLNELQRVHFIGIGGVGMSALAKVLIEQGIEVSGSDLKRSAALTTLEALGARVDLGHRADTGAGADLVVVSSAIPEDNPELRAARAAGVRVMSRGEALAALLDGSRSIVVAGTHGKTTTTSMIVSILRDAGLDPTYLVGGGLNDAGTNARYGRGPFSVAESDESDGSFLLLNPFVAVVTNVEIDHVDYWASLDDLYDAFEDFVGSVPEDGAVVVPVDDERLGRAARSSGRRVITVGPSEASHNDGHVTARDVVPEGGGMRFRLIVPAGEAEVSLHVPGAHNVANALSAAAAALAVDVPLERIASGLASYRGVERRFHVRGRTRGITIVDDYAHHPTEIVATLATASAQRPARVFAVFQPHRYSRTAAFATEFGSAFADADVVAITDVYGAGEPPVPGVTGKLIADSICERFPGRPVAYLPHRDELIAYVSRTARRGDLLLTLGAGDVTSVGEELLARLA